VVIETVQESAEDLLTAELTFARGVVALAGTASRRLKLRSSGEQSEERGVSLRIGSICWSRCRPGICGGGVKNGRANRISEV
jgi:hypothetical protein